ncbi:hypothetical protein ACIA6C_28065 [Streptomyces sp. NPDC051578]|uniref:hypothetical protein n=1 Tax=Streptomyces sp. NPDC051578 TaxID=3365662 RepID=UPI00378747A2
MARTTRRSKTEANKELPSWVKSVGRVYWASKGKTALLQAGPGMCMAADALASVPDGTKTAAVIGALAVSGTAAWARFPSISLHLPLIKKSIGWKRALPTRRNAICGISGAVTAAALMTGATAAGGPELGQNAFWGLGLMWGATYGTWWWRFRSRGDQAPELAGAERIIAAWAEHVTADRGLHPGTRLTEVVVADNGSWEGVAVALPGRTASVTAEQVASLYGVPLQQVAVHAVPDAAPNLARVRLFASARQVVELTGIEEKLHTWRTVIAARGGQLPGSRLEEAVDTDNGWRATVIAERGKQVGSLKIEDIVSAYQVDTSCVSYVGVPGRPYLAELTVMERNPLQDGVLFTNTRVLDPETGQATVGIRADGSPALYRFWRPKSGVVHSLIVGCTGSGKSRLLDELLVIERHNGIVSWVFDAQSGQSVPDWARDVDYYAAGALAAYRGLKAAHAVMLSRSARYAAHRWTDDKGRTRRGLKAFVPGQPDAILSVTLEEAAFLFREFPDAADMAADIAKMGRKCGVRIRIVLQDPKVDELGSSTLRGQLRMGNVVLLRTDGDQTNRLALGGSLDAVSPSQIPERFPNGTGTEGLGYLSSGEEKGGMFRGALVEDPLDWIEEGAENRVERASRDGAGKWYAAYRDWLDAARRGEDVADEPPGNEAEDSDAHEIPVPRPAIRRGGGKSADAAVNKARAAASEVPPRLPERITALLQRTGGPLERQQIVAALASEGFEVKANAVSAALKRLRERGEVSNLGHGLWAHTQHAATLAA